ncbi:class I SAM-dependent methyltransferase [Streptomyces sp. NPDC056656]|uniref:class I SAM-dependent methyltransferase n=1 Tax=Streptomyces sp. NPDC056656 TaxID=3345895 RepID=UPI003690EFE4
MSRRCKFPSAGRTVETGAALCSGFDRAAGATSGARSDVQRGHSRFELGSMTDLDLADGSMVGLVAWYSLIHIPDTEIGTVFKHFHRVLQPGGSLLLSFHVGDESKMKTEGYGGHPMKVHVHRRRHSQMTGWLNEAGFTVDQHRTLTSAESTLGGIILARRQPDTQ